MKSAWADIIASANRNYAPGRTHDLHRVRVHHERERPGQPAPQRRVSGRRGAGGALLPARLTEPGRSLGVDGRAAADAAWTRSRFRTTRTARTATCSPSRRPTAAHRRRLRRDADAQRTVDREHADQGHVGHASVPLAQRRVGGLRDLPLSDRHAAPAAAPQGSYAREAWRNGLLMQERRTASTHTASASSGATDTHNSGDVFDEDRFVSKVGTIDGHAEGRGSVPVNPGDEVPGYRDTASIYFGASGLAAVWAEENTRGAIFDAFRRKETYSTTGTWIRLRFFGGYGLSEDMLDAAEHRPGVRRQASPWAVTSSRPGHGCARLPGVGGPGPPGGEAAATADRQGLGRGRPLARTGVRRRLLGRPRGGSRRRIAARTTGQLGRHLGLQHHRGGGRQRTLDPLARPGLRSGPARAFYYVRVLENPTCRWSTWDAIRERHGAAGRASRRTIQERAFSSPIWVQPTG